MYKLLGTFKPHYSWAYFASSSQKFYKLWGTNLYFLGIFFKSTSASKGILFKAKFNQFCRFYSNSRPKLGALTDRNQPTRKSKSDIKPLRYEGTKMQMDNIKKGHMSSKALTIQPGGVNKYFKNRKNYSVLKGDSYIMKKLKLSKSFNSGKLNPRIIIVSDNSVAKMQSSPESNKNKLMESVRELRKKHRLLTPDMKETIRSWKMKQKKKEDLESVNTRWMKMDKKPSLPKKALKKPSEVKALAIVPVKEKKEEKKIESIKEHEFKDKEPEVILKEKIEKQNLKTFGQMTKLHGKTFKEIVQEKETSMLREKIREIGNLTQEVKLFEDVLKNKVVKNPDGSGYKYGKIGDKKKKSSETIIPKPKDIENCTANIIHLLPPGEYKPHAENIETLGGEIKQDQEDIRKKLQDEAVALYENIKYFESIPAPEPLDTSKDLIKSSEKPKKTELTETTPAKSEINLEETRKQFLTEIANDKKVFNEKTVDKQTSKFFSTLPQYFKEGKQKLHQKIQEKSSNIKKTVVLRRKTLYEKIHEVNEWKNRITKDTLGAYTAAQNKFIDLVQHTMAKSLLFFNEIHLPKLHEVASAEAIFGSKSTPKRGIFTNSIPAKKEAKKEPEHKGSGDSVKASPKSQIKKPQSDTNLKLNQQETKDSSPPQNKNVTKKRLKNATQNLHPSYVDLISHTEKEIHFLRRENLRKQKEKIHSLMESVKDSKKKTKKSNHPELYKLLDEVTTNYKQRAKPIWKIKKERMLKRKEVPAHQISRQISSIISTKKPSTEISTSQVLEYMKEKKNKWKYSHKY